MPVFPFIARLFYTAAPVIGLRWNTPARKKYQAKAIQSLLKLASYKYESYFSSTYINQPKTSIWYVIMHDIGK